MKKCLAFGIIFLFLVTCIIPFITFCNAKSDEYYFENVNVLVIGKCRTIDSDGTWMGGLFIGTQQCPGVQVTDTRFEGIRVKIYNESIYDPWFSVSGLTNSVVCMHNTKGIFFWACWKQFSAGPIPPIVFVSCHAEEVWVRF